MPTLRRRGPRIAIVAAAGFLAILVAGGIWLGAARGIWPWQLQPLRIPSESNVPTLEIGDRVVVAAQQPVRRGDLVAFRSPDAHAPLFIKRVVAQGGDTIEIKDERVWLNGKPLDEPYLNQDAGAPVPTIPGFSAGDAPSDWTLREPYAVPPGHYFVMGDNRTSSEDSRIFGPVPANRIIGRVMAIYWPPTRVHGL